MSDITEKNLQIKLADASRKRAVHSVLILAADYSTARCNIHSIPPNIVSHHFVHIQSTRVSDSDWAEDICHISTEGLSRTEKETLVMFQSKSRGVSE